MRRVISALAGSALLAAAGVVVISASASAAAPWQNAEAAAHAEWGALAAMAGRDWARPDQPDNVYRVLWREPGRILVWQYRSPGTDWADTIVYTKDSTTGAIRGEMPALGNRRGNVELEADGSVALVFGGMLPSRTRYSLAGDEIEISQSGRMIPTSTSRMVGVPNFTLASTEPPAAPRAPIIVAAAPEPGPPARSGTGTRGAARSATPTARTPAPAPAATEQSGPAGPGPIVIASAPPPPAAMREAPRGAAPTAPLTSAAAAGSREAQMQSQVEARRLQVAREAEAERQRQAAIAEQARQAEEARRAQQAADSASWGEAFGMLGALVGGVAAGSASGGDMTAITAGMAAGSSLAAPNSEITAAASQNFETERARYEAQQAQERELHERTMAAMNDPNNPLTRQQRQAETTRQERARTERDDMERRHREEREAEEREALEAQRTVESEADRSRQSEERERADAERRQAETRRLETERRQREAEAAEREAERQRQEEARRAEQEVRERAENDRRAEEERRRQVRQSRMARNTSGGFSTVGLPADARGGGGPGRGDISISLDHIAGCAATGATVRYSLSSIMGEPTVAGSFSWQGEEGCSLPSSTDAWVKVQSGTAYGWVPLDPAPPEANRGFGYNSTGSPNWGGLLCGFEGGSRTGCMDADSAKRLWAHGQVTEVRIGW